MNNTAFRTAMIGITIAVTIIAIIAACDAGGTACAATPTERKTTTPAKPTPGPTVTITRHGTYTLDVGTDDDC